MSIENPVLIVVPRNLKFSELNTPQPPFGKRSFFMFFPVETMDDALRLAGAEFSDIAFINSPPEEVVSYLRSRIRRPRQQTVPSGLISSFLHGDYVKKKSGSEWHGRVCGFYNTDLTKTGYAVENYYEKGSVQIYPESALEPWTPPKDKE